MMRWQNIQVVGKRVLLRQIMFTGYEAWFLIGFTALASSVIIIFEENQIMGQFGQTPLAYDIFVLIIIQQLSSFFTALVIIARSGTSIATELGNMVVNHEIDVLHSWGISPIQYLVIPRVLGVTISIFILSIYFNLIGIVGGFLFSHFLYDINSQDFFSQLFQQMKFIDIWASVIKSIFFGLFIGLISCYQGLKVKKAVTEVPQRTIRAVVYSLMAVFAVNVLVTFLSSI